MKEITSLKIGTDLSSSQESASQTGGEVER